MLSKFFFPQNWHGWTIGVVRLARRRKALAHLTKVEEILKAERAACSTYKRFAPENWAARDV